MGKSEQFRFWSLVIGICLVIGIWSLGFVVGGCGQRQEELITPTTTSTTTTTAKPGDTITTTTSTTTTTNSTGSDSISKVFNVSGAKAIASAMISSSKTTASRVRNMSVDANDLLKLTGSGELISILSLEGYRPEISVIETGPDGSLYVGFQWGISYYINGEFKRLAFFRITSAGTVEIVDDSIEGMGSWYIDSNFGELPVKQIQFDSEGNVYYLGRTSVGGYTQTVLRKKSIAGTISQIGSSNMVVRDFVVFPTGIVLFHGSNVNDWDIEWLRVINKDNAVYNLFYNDRNISGYGYLRSYFLDRNNNIILVGENLTIQLEGESAKRYSGILRAFLDSSGKPSAIEVLYDDKNMYSDSDNLGEQLINGYWDGGTYRKYLVRDNNGDVIVPLSLEAGVTEAEIRNFIRSKFKNIVTDSLNSLTFEGMTTSESNSWYVANWLDGIIKSYISGETWSEWRAQNGLQGVSFGNAKQLLYAKDGSVYAVMRLDGWSSSIVKGDRVYRLLNQNADPDIVAYPQDGTFKYMKRSRIYGDYLVYLSSTAGGTYKILRLNLTDPSEYPTDMTSGRNNVEIYSFNYNPTSNMLMYDIYDLSNNTTYLIEQELTSAAVVSENAASGYTIIDIVPFEANN